MDKNKALLVAGLIFALVAILHLVRYYFSLEIVVGGTNIPLSLSLVGFVVAGLLALWMFFARASKR